MDGYGLGLGLGAATVVVVVIEIVMLIIMIIIGTGSGGSGSWCSGIVVVTMVVLMWRTGFPNSRSLRLYTSTRMQVESIRVCPMNLMYRALIGTARWCFKLIPSTKFPRNSYRRNNRVTTSTFRSLRTFNGSLHIQAHPSFNT